MKLMSALLVVVCLLGTSPSFAQNLLGNPGFETGLAAWDGTAIISIQQAHSGAQSVIFDSGSDFVEQIVPVSLDSTYRLACWLYIDSAFSGNDWGGISISAIHYDWSGQYQGEFLTPNNRPVGVWFQEFIEFTPTFGNLRVRIGMFGGNGWNPRFFTDDVTFNQLGGSNLPPVISAVNASPVSGAVPLSVTVTASAVDPDGVVRLTRHDFGDGSTLLGSSASHIYGAPGDYEYSLTVVDDQGAATDTAIAIAVTESGYPFVVITSPTAADTVIVSDAVISLGGTLSSNVGSALWYNRRTDQSGAILPTSSFTTSEIGLAPGWNWIDVQARLPNGTLRSDEIAVRYSPPGYSGPLLSNFVSSAASVSQYDLWEIEFDVQSTATAPTLPYDDDIPPNLTAGSGLTVDAVLGNGIETLRWPAFFKAKMERHNGKLIPTGESVWCVRAAFKTTGLWTCTVEARDEAGTTSTTGPSVFVVPGDNRGFLRVSDNDDRYFEFDNGELFLPLGFGFPIGDLDAMDEELRRWTENGINFSRLWLSSRSPYSDPWCSFATHHPVTDNGYMPPPLLTTDEHFADGDVSWAIGAPAIAGEQTPAIFRGFWDGAVPVLPNRTYRVSARLKTANVSGVGGVVIKVGDWLGQEVTQAGVGTAISPYVTGSNDWCYLQGEYSTSGNQFTLPNLYIVLENVISGNAYIDQVTIQEIRSDGTLAENILSKSRANSHYSMDPYRSFDYDYLIHAACTSGVFLKLVVTEKDDWLLNRFDHFGFINPFDGAFETIRRSKSRRMMEYYWRHLIARWGYAVSVHSWELVNEGAPNSYADLTNHLAEYMHSISPYPRMVTTSFWSGWQPAYWNATNADYGDVHAYIMTTGWIDTVVVDGLEFNRLQLKEDPAAAIYAYAFQIGNDPARHKPVIVGETDLDMPGDQSPDPRLAQDFEGLWLHDFIWGHINSGGISALIWNNTNILNNNLHSQFYGFSNFMQTIQLHERGYDDIGATTSTNNLRAWGQRDSLGEHAHIWIKNRQQTWARVLASGPAETVSGAIDVQNLRPGPATLVWHNTLTGFEIGVDTLDLANDGHLHITISDLQDDIALKFTSLPLRPIIHGVTIAVEPSHVILRWPAVGIPCVYRIWKAASDDTPFEAMTLAGTTTSVSWQDSLDSSKEFYVVECVPLE